MSDDDELLKCALRSAKTGWNRYLKVVGAVYLLLVIDFMTGRQFLNDEANISLLGFKVPRIAFSVTYATLFGLFALWAAGSSRIVRSIVDECREAGIPAGMAKAPEVRLWTLSPLQRSRPIRHAFWMLVLAGLALLVFVTVVHLFCINTPSLEDMSVVVYQGIGYYCLAVLAVACLLAWRRVLPDWAHVREAVDAESR